MEINGIKITDVRTYSIEGLAIVKREGEKMLKLDPSKVDQTEEALIIAAKYALQYEEIAKKHKKLPKKQRRSYLTPTISQPQP